MELPGRGGLVIAKFTDESKLQDAGAKVKDILWRYNGIIVQSVEQLGELKTQVTTEMVDVELYRQGELLCLQIPAGQIGIYLLPLAQKRTIDKDAVIIEGIGKLQWGKDMDNSFFGALTQIEELKGQKLSYNDLMVLSGYGIRTSFFESWCPSSVDATCGFDCGSEILTNLGYKYEYLFLKGKEKLDANPELNAFEQDELIEKITSSIDNGWPVLAIDLIEVPEWGIVTGYQKNGKELFCRTYFDKSEGYEIAQKIPWVVLRIYDKEELDIAPLYKKALTLAEKLYETESFNGYTNGIKAIQTWITHLQNEEDILKQEPAVFTEISFDNSWIYYCLADARAKTAKYLLEHKADFQLDEAMFTELCDIYNREADILMMGMQNTAPLEGNNDPQTWTPEMRTRQILTLEEFLNLEQKAMQLLKAISGQGKI